MNKGNYQLVFNAARGCIMAVSEVALRSGKTTGEGAVNKTHKLKAGARLVGVTMSVLYSALLQAQIVADPSAPGNQRPTVLTAPNAVPLVNIQTPSAAGVSRNTYRQFDVGGAGVVLNNSRTNVQTQTGGWVQGNPWLARGQARVILNEINSSNPSQLKGFVEVAGQQAEVIIANPAGINVDGAGFINASRATLTTGTPVINGGSLESYRVQGGTIRIEGAGLDTRHSDYTGILARAVEANAAIHAKELKVITGQNTISAEQTTVTPNSDASATGSEPAFALDIGQLGGMYAGKITLVGTEAGVGVRNHGTLSASAADIVISSNGWLSSTGAIESKQGHISVQTAQGQTYGGSLAAAGNLTLQSGSQDRRAVLSNSASMRAGHQAHIRADGMVNSGKIDARRLDVAVTNLSNTGDIWQSGTQALHIQAQTLNNGQGSAVGAVQTGATPAGSVPSAGASAAAKAASSSEPSGAVPSGPSAAPVVLADGQIAVSGTLSNQDRATLASAGDLHLGTSQALSNAGHIRAQSVQVQGDRFENSAGTLESQQLDVQTQAVVLKGGAIVAQNATLSSASYNQASGVQLYTRSALRINTGELNNAGEIQSATTLSLDVQKSPTQSANLSNTGTIGAGGQLSITAGNIKSSGTLAAGLNNDGSLKAFDAQGAKLSINAQGQLSATGKNLAAGALELKGAQIDLSTSQSSAYSADISAQQGLSTDNSKLITMGQLTAQAQSMSNAAGSIYAGQGAKFSIGQGLSNTGTIGAGGQLSITAGNIKSSGTLAAGLNNDGSLKAFDAQGAKLSINAQGQLSATGKNLAAGALEVKGGQIDLSTSQSSAHSADISAQQGLSSRAANIVTQGDLTLKAQGALDNTAGTLASKAGALNVSANGVNNTQGLIVAAIGASIDAKNANLDNTRGQILAQGAMQLSTSAQVINTAGLMQSGAALSVAAGAINNSQTKASAQGILGQDVTLQAQTIDNTDGQVLASRDLTGRVGSTLTNTRGTLSAQRKLSLQDSSPALVSAPQWRALTIGNHGGLIIANSATDPKSSSLDISAKTLGLDGTVQSGGDMALNLVGDLSTAQGQQVRAGRNLSVQLHSGQFDNAGQWQAGQDLSIRADHIYNRVSGELLSRGQTILQTSQNSAGSLLNWGLIDGADTRITSHIVDNIGTGRIYGDRIAIAANTVRNREETVNGQTTAATIAARERLDIGAQQISNREGALIFSAGDMAIGGALDGNHRARVDGSANAQSLNNNSATIESLGHMALAAQTLRNTNDHLNWLVVPDAITYEQENLSDTVYRVYTQATHKVDVLTSAPARISAGGDLYFGYLGSGLNQDSQIVVGGAITGQVGALNNEATKVSAPTLRSGTVYDWGITGKDCGWYNWSYSCKPVYGWRANPYQESIDRELAVPALRYEQHNRSAAGAGAGIGALAHTGGH